MKSILTPSIRYMFLATVFFASMQSFVKYLSDYSVYQVLFFRSVITALFCIAYLKNQNISLIGNSQKWLLLRALTGCLSMVFFFITIQRIPLGAAVSLKYLSPIFTAVFAIFFLKERVYPVQWLFFAMAFGGVLLLKGFDTRIDTLNLMIGIAGAVLAGLVYTIIRKIGTSEHPMVIIHYFMTFSAIITGILMIPHWQNPTLVEWTYLFSIGALGYFAQVFMTKALQSENASRTIQVKYVELVFSLSIGLIWFGETYSLISFLGIVLILVAMLLNVSYKQKSTTKA